MMFKVLGPLTVLDGEHQIPLGGTRQRATLGVLLLQPNLVVPTSKLLRALWPTDDVPASSRKILQNSVWSLRTLFNSQFRCSNPPALITCPPGYMIRVDPEQIDNARFLQQAELGRSKVASAPAEAVLLLREALSLWKGPALADLSETGIMWPELSALQRSRLGTLESLFEAELACGRHESILGELQALVETETFSERACEQLMLAMYRCGRQADALNTYTTIRETLNDLGLEPGLRLRDLQQAILNHSPALNSPNRIEVVDQACSDLSVNARSHTMAESVAGRASDLPATMLDSVGRDGEVAARLSVETTGVATAGSMEAPRPAARDSLTCVTTVPSSSPRMVSVLLIRAVPAFATGSPSIDVRSDTVAARVQQLVSVNGGVNLATLGSTTAVLFDLQSSTELAVQAARELHATLGATADPTAEMRVAIAVITRESYVHDPGDGDAPVVSAGLIEDAHRLLDSVPDGEIKLSPSHGDIVDVSASESDELPFIDREHEMSVLNGLLELVRHRSCLHSVTVRGGQSIGKTRLLAEFTDGLLRKPVRVLQTAARAAEGPLDLPRRVVASLCGIIESDSRTEALNKLNSLLVSIVAQRDERKWLGHWLRPFVDPPCDSRHLPFTAEIMLAWRLLLADAAAREPVVLVVDDLHLAHGAVQQALAELEASARAVPILIVTAAQPALFVQRDRGGHQTGGTTITLSPLSDAGVERMLQVPRSRRNRSLTRAMRSVATALLAEPEQNKDTRRLMRDLMTAAPDWDSEQQPDSAPSESAVVAGNDLSSVPSTQEDVAC